jgi:hypothetical protein
MLSPKAAGLNREATRLLAQLQEMEQRLRDLREELTALLERASPDAQRVPNAEEEDLIWSLFERTGADTTESHGLATLVTFLGSATLWAEAEVREASWGP